jgi:hypothetical protein
LEKKAIVINTDPHDQPGAHWVCVYLNSPVVEYFDSYGLAPMHRDIQDFIARHGKGVHNPHVYQDLNTDVCGQYCVYYLHQRHRSGKTVRDWILPWKGTSLQRDHYVDQWFKETFRKPRNGGSRWGMTAFAALLFSKCPGKGGAQKWGCFQVTPLG